MNHYLNILILALVFFFNQNNPSAQNYHETLDNIAFNNQLIGMSVAIVCNGSITDIHHYGIADINRNITVTDSTMFRIASISKSVTATALMKLFEEGLFGLDDNVSEYLGFNLYNPQYPSQSITFRMLLSHTSGLSDGSGYSSFLSATASQNPPPHINQLLSPGGLYFTSNMWLSREPGTWFSYANVNYGVIGTLIERLSGMRFDIYVRENILLPLGIHGSFNISDIGNINNVAVLYRNSIPQADNYQGIPPPPRDLSQYTIGTNGLIFSPQGGLRISAADLCNFMIMQANDGLWGNTPVLDSATVNLMHQTHWNYNGNNGNNYYNLFRRWGLGFHLTTNTLNGDIVIPGTPMTGHPGEAYGLISDMYFEKAKQFGLIFITNGYSGSAGYAWGNYSAFYLPEEQIFNTIRQFQFNSCFPVSVQEGPDHQELTPIRYNSGLNQLEIVPEIRNGTLQLYNLTGRLCFSTGINKSFVQLPELNKGIYFVRIISSKENFGCSIAL
jgi:CubicO group peptidase (beta-lactamase class C family)